MVLQNDAAIGISLHLADFIGYFVEDRFTEWVALDGKLTQFCWRNLIKSEMYTKLCVITLLPMATLVWAYVYVNELLSELENSCIFL